MILVPGLVFLTYFLSVDAACPGVVSKKDWHGLTPLQVEYLPRPVSLVIIQHTVTNPCSTDASCVDIVQSIQNIHMDQNNYWDIGMNFLIGGNGKVYEGTGWLHVGAHTYKYNRKSIGISFIGNFNGEWFYEYWPGRSQLCSGIQFGVSPTYLSSPFKIQLYHWIEDTPTNAALDAAKALLKCGVEQGHLKQDYNLVAHKKLIATESPGRNIYSEIRTWDHYLDDVSSIKNTE